MEEKVLSQGFLLNEDGNLTEAGYATSLVKEYSRKHIKASSLRIKEWDYYYVGNDHFGVALTIADNSYMGLGSVSIFDFDKKFWKTKSIMTLMPKGKTNLPESSNVGDVSFNSKRLKISFLNNGSVRRLICTFKKFYKKNDFTCDIILKDDNLDSMVIATPFHKPKHFYYNQKINCQRAFGSAQLGKMQLDFNQNDAFGVLDWGRGVWTYKNTWYWSSLSGQVNGVKIGFNFGYGFGDTSKASENMIFFDGRAYKVDQVVFEIPKTKNKYEYLKTWKIVSNDHKVNLNFEPIFDRNDNTDIIFIKSLQHQVFGRFSGTLMIDDMTIEIKNMVGFAERVTNYW